MVPTIELIHDPDVNAKAEELKAQGKKVSTDDFDDRLKDSNFIKRLEKTVTQWIKDIRKIT